MTGLLLAFYAWIAVVTGVCPTTGPAASGPGQSQSCPASPPPPPSNEPKRPDWAPSASTIYNGF